MFTKTLTVISDQLLQLASKIVCAEGTSDNMNLQASKLLRKLLSTLITIQ